MKKILKALPVLGIAALALASCGGNANENAVGNSNSKNKFTVWAADKANDLTKQQLTNFLNENKDIDAYFTVEKVSEAVKNIVDIPDAIYDIYTNYFNDTGKATINVKAGDVIRTNLFNANIIGWVSESEEWTERDSYTGVKLNNEINYTTY